MQIKKLLLLLLLCCVACKRVSEEKFDTVKWKTKHEMDYPYRNNMLNDLMAHYELHGLKLDELVALLGYPDRSDSGYLFYTIAQERWGFFPLHTKTLVIKLTRDSAVEWRKIHE